MEIRGELEVEKLLSNPDLNMMLALCEDQMQALAPFEAIERSWKEIENFEFRNMDLEASFTQLLKKI